MNTIPPSPNAFERDDVLFPAPRGFETWEGCIDVWNANVDFVSEWDKAMVAVLERSDNGVFADRDAEIWDRALDPLIQRLVRATEIERKAVDLGLRLRLGFGIGSVVEVSDDAGTRLVKIGGGGLPRSAAKADVRMHVTSVERLGEHYVTAAAGIQILQGPLEQIERETASRPDITALEATSPGVMPLPAEVFDEDVLRQLRSTINPNGLLCDRRATLLAFFHETIWKREQQAAKYQIGDIVRIRQKSRKPRNVVFHGFVEKHAIWCHDPQRRSRDGGLAALTHLAVEQEQVSVSLPRMAFNPSDASIPTSASMLLAVRENTRSQRDR